ncbi:hypothetical protein [Chromobacterium violaceum]|uniref:DUF7868 domain-containing protein n=1 Tax=Chromobacterium violaceum TaxID=536 RepID=UPI001C8BD6D7|nr:hypothetical protein [Chromobacterium violaceum]MBX9268025.1 hypothetical protein [Chromobacterium violaceum]
MSTEHPSEMVAATQESFPLASRGVTVGLPVAAPTGPALKAQAGGKPRQAYLRVERITGKGMPPGYEIYLHPPGENQPSRREELCAGVLPLFGLDKASRQGAGHAGTGLHYVFDVTELMERLEREPGWDPQDLRVTFVPRRQPRQDAEVRVGRVSLYYA